MEDNQDEITLIKVMKFNNRRQDLTEFVQKSTAVADERGYDKILGGSEIVPAEVDTLAEDETGKENNSGR